MFEVRPGITGWAQVNGRKEVEWNKRIELNVWYVDHVSLWLDIKIIFMTVFKVFTNANNENKGATVLPQVDEQKANDDITTEEKTAVFSQSDGSDVSETGKLSEKDDEKVGSGEEIKC